MQFKFREKIIKVLFHQVFQLIIYIHQIYTKENVKKMIYKRMNLDDIREIRCVDNKS